MSDPVFKSVLLPVVCVNTNIHMREMDRDFKVFPSENQSAAMYTIQYRECLKDFWAIDALCCGSNQSDEGAEDGVSAAP